MCHRRCCNVVEHRDTARNMTTPARVRWVLRRAPGKRPPKHSVQRKCIKLGVRRQVFSSESQFGFQIRQRFAKIAASEVANGKSRTKGLAMVTRISLYLQNGVTASNLRDYVTNGEESMLACGLQRRTTDQLNSLKPRVEMPRRGILVMRTSLRAFRLLKYSFDSIVFCTSTVRRFPVGMK